jgi:hypothetical protein
MHLSQERRFGKPSRLRANGGGQRSEMILDGGLAVCESRLKTEQTTAFSNAPARCLVAHWETLMKRVFIILVALAFVVACAGEGLAQSKGGSKSGGSKSGGTVHVNGYTTKNGTHVQPHNRSGPDGVFQNNYTTKGNTNPFTGQPGTVVTPPKR